MDKALEEKVKQCDACQRSRNQPTPAPIQSWEWPEKPWARLHVDYAGPLEGHIFLVLVDAHSKWMDVRLVKKATSTTTISHLRAIFATHGLPELLVSDNGSVFTSGEFQDFLKQNGIRHSTSAPYHPATNGLAGRAMQIFKLFLKKCSDGSLEDRLSKFLSNYRLTPHTTTGLSPAELLFGRRPRSRLDLVRPNLAKHVRTQQEQQKLHRDQHSKVRKFSVGDAVYVCDLPSKKDWLPGIIQSMSGPLYFQIDILHCKTVRRHSDHIRPRDPDTSLPPPASDLVDLPDPIPPNHPSPPDLPPAEPPPSVRRSAQLTTRTDRLVEHLYVSS